MANFQKRKIGDEDVKIERFHTPGKEKTIYLEIDDEVTAAFDRIKRVRAEEIFLVAPKRAVLLQSIVNLKILKKKADELGKKIIMVTQDHTGLRLARDAGFSALEKLPVAGEAVMPVDLVPSSKDKTARPTKLEGQKFSISQLLKHSATSGDPLILRAIEWFKKRRKKKKYTTEIVVVTPSKPALITLVVIAVFLLLVIAYIALPGATIYITPASSRIEQPVNITLLDYENYRTEFESQSGTAVMASYKISPPSIIHIFHMPATGKIFRGENASGTITIFNESSLPWPLVAETRFQTEEGLVFRIKQPVTVPPAKGNSPGALNAAVKADSFDAYGQIIGGRGNIGPSRFFLPGLKNPGNRKKLYAVSKEQFLGGLSRMIKTVSEDDIKAGKEKAKKEITALAKKELEKFIEQQNRERNTTLALLKDSRTVAVEEPSAEILGDPAGREIEAFDIKAEIKISATAVNMRELLNLMKKEMGARKSPEKKIVKMVEDSLTYRIFEIDNAIGKIRMTATLRGIEQYDIDTETENGEKLLKKIRDHIAGKDIDEATFFMQNLPEIDRVEIKSWPFWAPTLPTMPDNIKFEIKSENPLEIPNEK